MTQETKCKIMKMSSGEEIICHIVGSDNPESVNISFPLRIMTYPKATRNGLEEALSLQRWIHFSEGNTYRIDRNQIIVMAPASIGLSRFYEYCVNKMNAEGEEIVPPTNEELRRIEAEIEDEYNDWEEPVSKTYH